MPVLPKAQPGPEVRIYDSNTGKLIRTGARGPPAPPSSLPICQEPSSFSLLVTSSALEPLRPSLQRSYLCGVSRGWEQVSFHNTRA
ncbi:hypothetical protein P7K49_027853 [Saguinus oedipus]|uniref:FCP1-like phosphatase C-terminal domain-containing protein n=1 Tax=Saguinus oedipus TaxID=9490 RepID=A0ABQ9UAQ7_SAGOE|nr:hypothetical protein P7K49_027853 [Saguinus oedipus]